MVIKSRQWPVGGRFGGRGGNRRKEAVQQVAASEGTAETGGRGFDGNREDQGKLALWKHVGLEGGNIVLLPEGKHGWVSARGGYRLEGLSRDQIDSTVNGKNIGGQWLERSVGVGVGCGKTGGGCGAGWL